MDRILSVHSGGHILRGSEFSLLDHLATMHQNGRSVRLLCDSPVMMTKATSIGIDTRLIPRGEIMYDPPTVKFQFAALFRSNLRVLRAIKAFKPHVVYCNGGRALQMAYLAARLSRTPVAVHLRIPHTRRYLVLYGTPLADLVIHCSDELKVEHERKARFRRSVGFPNSIDERNFPTIDNLRRPGEASPPAIGFIGHVDHIKGVDVLIRAVHLLHKNGTACKLLIAGPEANSTFRNLATELGVAAQFLGEIPRAELPDFFAQLHIHALPSRRDAMARTIIEAAYCGVPSIATTVGGIPEAMLGGKLGLLYDKNTPEELAIHLQKMLDSDWISREKSIAIAGLARRQFSQATNTENLCALLTSLARAKSTLRRC